MRFTTEDVWSVCVYIFYTVCGDQIKYNFLGILFCFIIFMEYNVFNEFAALHITSGNVQCPSMNISSICWRTQKFQSSFTDSERGVCHIVFIIKLGKSIKGFSHVFALIVSNHIYMLTTIIERKSCVGSEIPRKVSKVLFISKTSILIMSL